jgi:hypothetical protein
MYEKGFSRTVRGHRRRSSIQGSVDAALAKLHGWLLFSARQMRYEDRTGSMRYMKAAAHVKKAFDALQY